MEKAKQAANSVEALRSKDIDILASTMLFSRITRQEIETLTKCLKCRRTNYSKGEYPQYAGEPFKRIGIVLEGSVDIIFEDSLGRKSILTTVETAGMFGEGVVTARAPVSPVSVCAVTDASICFLEYPFLIRNCEQTCSYHYQLIENMLEIMSRKMMILNKKLNYALTKSLRDKVVNYLADEYGAKSSTTFEIGYNREELANYLAVDRSSLSRELAKMKEEGLIDFRKFEFTLNKRFFECV